MDESDYKLYFEDGESPIPKSTEYRHRDVPR